MRYAIYFAAPESDPLMRLGNRWLGRDPFSGAMGEQPLVPGFARERLQALTTDPRRYGFHGTLKAPFALPPDRSEAELVATCTGFAETLSPFQISGLGVNRLGKFLALTPDQAEPNLTAFAAACVVHFEPFRAPLSDADRVRRRQANLTPKQDGYVETWGYPYVFDEFRFHMTLSNKLESDAEAVCLSDAAKHHFKAVTDRPRNCRHFGLYTEQERGAPFMVHSIYELTGQTAPQDFPSPADIAATKENA